MSPRISIESRLVRRQPPDIHRERRLGEEFRVGARASRAKTSARSSSAAAPSARRRTRRLREMGITAVGILVSARRTPSSTPSALAPELRTLDGAHVHRVRDYTGASTKRSASSAPTRSSRSAARTATRTSSRATASWPKTRTSCAPSKTPGSGSSGPAQRCSRPRARRTKPSAPPCAERVSGDPGRRRTPRRAACSRKHPTSPRCGPSRPTHGLAIDPAVVDARSRPRRGGATRARGERTQVARRLSSLSTSSARDRALRAGAVRRANPGSRVRLKAIGGGGGKGQRILDGVAVGDGRPRVRPSARSGPRRPCARSSPR
jgi:hypothetical protein